jgi:hypothetical protein
MLFLLLTGRIATALPHLSGPGVFTDGELRSTGPVGWYEAEGRIVVAAISASGRRA